MFQNLDQVKSWLQNGGTAIPHTLVAGEEEWITAEIERIHELVEQDKESAKRDAEANAKAEQEAADELKAYEESVAARSNDATTHRFQAEIATNQVLRDAKRAEVNDQIGRVAHYGKGTAERAAAGKRLGELQREAHILKDEHSDLRRKLREYQAPTRPTSYKWRERTHTPQVAPYDADLVVKRYEGLLAAATGGTNLVNEEAEALRSQLQQLAKLAVAAQAAAKNLAHLTGRDAEVFQPIIDAELGEDATSALRELLGVDREDCGCW